MKEPLRLRDPRSGLDAQTRALLLDERPPAPKDADLQRIWSNLAVQIAPLPIPPPIPAPLAAGVAGAAATGTILGKITLVAVTAAVGAGVGWQGLRSRHPAGPQPQATPAHVAVRSAPSQPGTPGLHAIAAVTPPSSAIGESPTMLPPMPPIPSLSPQKRMRLETAAKAPGSAAKPLRFVSPSPAPALVPAPAPALAPAPAPAAIQIATAPTSLGPPPQPESPLAARETRARTFGEAPSPPAAGAGEIAGPIPPATTYSRALVTARTTGRPSTHATHALAEESLCLANARAALRSRNPDRALDLLKTTPSSPALAQEREALTIEAMAQKPDLRVAAAERARLFLQAYPDSPYRAIISSLAGKRD